MPNKKSKTKYKLLIKIDIPNILKDWLEKGELTEDEIPKVDTNLNLFYGDD